MSNLSRREFIKKLHLFGLTLAFYKPTNLLSTNLKPYYPPLLTGIRGNHEGTFKYAHKIAFENKKYKTEVKIEKEYDLIVVGAGISGLSSAYYYLENINKNAKILILDNHDDFGGHAKRNEFIVDGKTLLSYGGTQSFDNISSYSDTANDLLKSLGIELSKFEEYYDKDFFDKNDLTSGIFYPKDTFDNTNLIKSALPINTKFIDFSNGYMPYLKEAPSFKSTLKDIPLKKELKDKLLEVIEGNENINDYEDLNYVEFLKESFNINEKPLLELLSNISSDDAALAGKAISLEEAKYSKFLGLSKSIFELSSIFSNDKYIHHFPDGNATLARLLVKRLIPSISNFSNVEECVSAKFDYTKLDNKSNNINIRLNSYVSSIENINNKTNVQYIKDDVVYEIQSKHTIMAGWHSVAATIIKDLPKRQEKALKANVKMPLVYVQVALKNWKFIKKVGIASTYCPSSYCQFVNMDFPINIGKYNAIRNPDEPTILTMMRMPSPTDIDKEVIELLRLGRYELLGTSYNQFKENIKNQLEEMYSKYGFNYERDVSDITINRWSHGYTYEGALEEAGFKKKEARKTFGNIYFANADSAGSAYTDAAIDMAYMAVSKIAKRG